MMLSRVADNLYWMSRYLERAQHTARLLDVTLDLLPEQSPQAAEKAWEKLFSSLGTNPPVGNPDAFLYMQRLTFDAADPNTIAACISVARENARQVREQISSEMWEQINRLYLSVNAANAQAVWEAQPHAFFQEVKQGTHLFQGISDSTMNRGHGWQFIQLGQFIERAVNVATLLDVHLRGMDFNSIEASHEAHHNAVSLLRSCTAWEAFCKVYTADTRIPLIAEFLLLNAEFPHAVHFAVIMMHNALLFIADTAEQHKNSQVLRAVGRLKALLDYGQIEEIISQDLTAFLQDVRHQCQQIHALLYQNYIYYPVEDKLPS